MSSKFEKFKALHHTAGAFLLPNAWNVKSALRFQEHQFPAIGTSSAAIANSLGYEDGETMPFGDYLFVIKRILSSVQVSLSVDLEMGYGTTDEKIYENVWKLVDLGVTGINIEDSVITKQGRVLKDANLFANTITHIKNRLTADGLDLFVNIRCDTFILDVTNKQKETAERLKIYETTGADGIFLPCISAEEDITEAVNSTKLPLNVMCVPGLPDFSTLNKLGVKRISMGPFLFNKIYDEAGRLSRAIMDNNSFLPIH